MGFCTDFACKICGYSHIVFAQTEVKKGFKSEEIALFAVTELKIGENYERFETFALL